MVEKLCAPCDTGIGRVEITKPLVPCQFCHEPKMPNMELRDFVSSLLFLFC